VPVAPRHPVVLAVDLPSANPTPSTPPSKRGGSVEWSMELSGVLHGCSTITPRWSSVDLPASVRRAARPRRDRPDRRGSSSRSIAAAFPLRLERFRTSGHRSWCAHAVAGDGAIARGPLRDTRSRRLDSIRISMTLDEAEHHGRAPRSRLPSQIQVRTSRGELLTSRLALSSSRKARNLSRRVRSASQRLPSLYEAGGAHGG
jgi:hypothetical protein